MGLARFHAYRHHADMHAQAPTDRELAQAYQYCLTIARRHYENFPTASRFIKKDYRPAVAAIYAFARHADDLADEGNIPADTRLKQLNAWETLLERCLTESLEQPVFLALSDSIRKHHLPVEALHNLLIAFRMDVSLHAYASEDELMFYCVHSANPVGRLMLALHEVDSPEALQASDAICTALQLVNFWQDLSVDLPRGRCYLPEAWLEAHGLNAEQLLDWARTDALADDVHNQAVAPALKHAVAITREKLVFGQNLLPWLPLRLRLQIATTLHGADCMLNRIETLQRPLAERVTLTRRDWLRMVLPVIRDTLLPPRPMLPRMT